MTDQRAAPSEGAKAQGVDERPVRERRNKSPRRVAGGRTRFSCDVVGSRKGGCPQRVQPSEAGRTHSRVFCRPGGVACRKRDRFAFLGGPGAVCAAGSQVSNFVFKIGNTDLEGLAAFLPLLRCRKDDRPGRLGTERLARKMALHFPCKACSDAVGRFASLACMRRQLHMVQHMTSIEQNRRRDSNIRVSNHILPDTCLHDPLTKRPILESPLRLRRVLPKNLSHFLGHFRWWILP